MNGVICPICYRRWGCTMPDLPLSVCCGDHTHDYIQRLRDGDLDWPRVFDALDRYDIEVSPRAAQRMQVQAARIRLLRSASPTEKC